MKQKEQTKRGKPTHNFINIVLNSHAPDLVFGDPKLLSCTILVHEAIAGKVINSLRNLDITIELVRFGTDTSDNLGKSSEPKAFETDAPDNLNQTIELETLVTDELDNLDKRMEPVTHVADEPENKGKSIELEPLKYDLKIHGKCFDMRIIRVQCTKDNAEEFHDFILNSQCSFPWEDNPTLYISVKDFNVLQVFIRKNNLEQHIIKIEEQPGYSVVDGHDIIKVVTFNQSVFELNIIQQFAANLMHYRNVTNAQYYFTVYAFQWLQPQWLEHLKIPIHNRLYQTFYIIVNHLGYNNGLNIFDLLMLRITLCDYRNPSPSRQLKYEIDFFIQQELSKIVKNEHLDIDQYLVNKNYNQIDFLINYLIYEFQHYFSTVTRKSEFSSTDGSIKMTKIHGRIELVSDPSKVLKEIKEKYNVIFSVSGAKCDGMCLSLFLDLLGCPNVDSIELNTDSTWTSDECELNRPTYGLSSQVSIHLTGENTGNFIEGFISSLKTITFLKRKLLLYISHNLNDYRIFDNLSVHKINLAKIKIDDRILDDLHKCELKSKIFIHNGTFENTLSNWKLFYDVREFVNVRVHEDENTFEIMLTFIADYLQNTNAKEFQFDTYYLFQVICGGENGKVVSFDEIKFVVDEVEAKLELRDNFSKKIIDLYELKNEHEPNDKSNYDFYQ